MRGSTTVRRRALLAGAALFWSALPGVAGTVLDADFESDEDGFVYQDDAFRGSNEPSYASGSRTPAGGFGGAGLQVSLGGLDGADIDDMSGGWQRSFTVAGGEPLELAFRYDLRQSADYDNDELTQVMVAVDGVEIGTGNADFVAEIEGDGNGGGERSTGWRSFRADLGVLAPGTHVLVIGGYNNRKTSTNEFSDILIDDVLIAGLVPAEADLSAQAIVDELDLSRFESNVAMLAGFNTRHWSQQGNLDAGDWIESELMSYGYTVERHTYTFQNEPRDNIYATRIGTLHPERMFIASAHMDSVNSQSPGNTFAPGADDDASGTSLVLEAARVFAPASVQTDSSIRFILWNNEETGLDGSEAYVADRASLQGIESPPGSGQYPEPTWLGIIQHDMILFDHGLPVQANQIPGADVDIEYQSAAAFVGDAIELATTVHGANLSYATDYPAEVSADMNFTDSKSFQGDCPAISVRENRRVAEIGNGANPNWHKNTDVVATYSPEDFLLGFNAVQGTVGALAELAGAVVLVCGDGIVPPAEGCDDDNTDPGDGCDGNCQVEAGFTCAGQPSVCAVCRTDSLRFAAPDRDTFSWEPPAPAVCPVSHDVATGPLAALRSNADFAAAACLDDDTAATSFTDPASPAAGQGVWYLTRVDGDSWLSPIGAGAAARDATLAACP